MSADSLLDAEVISRNGEEIGGVSNAVFNAQNQMVGLIAEVGGVWGIGDTHIAVPFQQLRFTGEGVQVPVTEDNYGQYRLFEGQSFLSQQALQRGAGDQGGQAQGGQAQARQWRLTALMDDYATFPGGAGYGYVDAVLISEQGQIQAVVVQTAAEAFRAGHFAFPFDAYAGDWQPGDAAFVIPYPRQEVQRLEPFRINRYADVLR